MGEAKNILLVTNSTNDTEITEIKRAVARAEQQGMKVTLNLVHVIPTLPACYFNIPSMVHLTERYYEEAKHALTVIGETLDVAKKNQWLITGRIKNEVMRLASKLNIHFVLASSASVQDLEHSLVYKKEEDR